MYDELRAEMVQICRTAYNRGHVSATNGNISARTPDGRGLIIKASGVSFARIAMCDLLFVDWSGNVSDCEEQSATARKPSIELGLHMCLYPLSPQTGAVAHLHSPHATALSYGADELPLVVLEARHILKRVPVVPVHPAGSPELVDAVQRAFQNTDVVAAVLAEHGPVVTGRTLEDAYNNADTLEHNAHIALLTRLLHMSGRG